MRAFILFSLLFATGCRSEVSQWERAVIYFRPWNSESVVAVSPNSLREMTASSSQRARKTEITSPKQIQALVEMLDLPRLAPMKCDPRENTRLVVDLFDRNGMRTSFRSSGASLHTEDCQTGHPIDDKFRAFFARYAP